MSNVILTAVIAFGIGTMIGAAAVENSPRGCTTLVLENVGR